MTILEHIRNSTPTGLYTNGSPEDSLSSRGSEIIGTILRVEILTFEKIDFRAKVYENFLGDQCPLLYTNSSAL